jgi:hypothetical protein
MNIEERTIIGASVLVDIGHSKSIPAKIDTGADSSSIGVSNLRLTSDNRLEFALFDPSSDFYTGETYTVDDYAAVKVKSSNGTSEFRYRAPLSLRIAGHRIRATFTLADRSHARFKILIGRRTLGPRFLIAPDEEVVPIKAKGRSLGLSNKLKSDPQKFHQTYIKNERSKK